MKTYQCTKCGKIASEESAVCSSTQKISSFYVCESCNRHSVDQESMCKPVKIDPSFFCGKCGTSAHAESELCEPVSV